MPEVTSLEGRVEITVPTRCMCGRPLEFSRIKIAQDSAARFLRDLFGGAQVGRERVDGTWADENGVIDEVCLVMRAGANPRDLTRANAEIESFAEALAESLSQKAVAVFIVAGGATPTRFVSSPRSRCKCPPDRPDAATRRRAQRVMPALPEQLGVYRALQSLSKPEGRAPLKLLRDLFCTHLGFEPSRSTALGFSLAEGTAALLAEDPQLVARHGDFRIIFCRLRGDRLSRTSERRIATAVRRELPPHVLFAFANESLSGWHLVHPKRATDEAGEARLILRRMEIDEHGRFRTACEALAAIRVDRAHSPDALAIDERIAAAFNVERVGKAFFDRYREELDRLGKAIEEENRGRPFARRPGHPARGYARLLMQRLVFLHFIQRKGWLNGNPKFLSQEFFSAYSSGRVFHDDFLGWLFFDALSELGATKSILGRTFEIPYLDGGLFARHPHLGEQDAAGLGGPTVSNEALDPVFEFLDSFNFTVTEATPLDQPAEIDPEMLGRVFENLLEEDVRKEEGTYYTPRPIVQFMCREALFRYLHGKAGIERATLASLYPDDPAHESPRPEWDEKLARGMREALDTLRVLDPAVGSGAFPLGMMQEMLHLYRACSERLAEPRERFDAARAELKRGIIERSLYGVDIRPEAAEIAKLRLWLALVIDEQEPDPLPNLDFRILVGDSLRERFAGVPFLPIKRTKKQLALPFEEDAKARQRLLQLAKQQHKFFDARTDGERGRIKQEIDGAISDAIEKTLDEEERRYRAAGDDQGVSRIRVQRDAVRTSGGVLPILAFRLYFADAFAGGDDVGFDIVIANPPYIRIQNLESELARHYKAEEYRSATKNFDVYALFVERGLDLLRNSGHLCYILPNKFQNADYGAGLRSVIGHDPDREKPKGRAKGKKAKAAAPAPATSHVVQIVDFLRNQPFGATNYTHILTLAKTPQPELEVIRFETEIPRSEQPFEADGAIGADLARLVAARQPRRAPRERYSAEKAGTDPWILPVGEKRALVNRLCAMRAPTLEGLCEIFQGIVTSADPVYILEVVDEPAGRGLVSLCRRAAVHKGSRTHLEERRVVLEERFLKTTYKSRSGVVDAYYLSPPTHRIFFPYRTGASGGEFIPQKTLEREAPRTWQWLKEHEALLRGRESGKMDKDGWWDYVYPKNLTCFDREKLVIVSFSVRGRFSYHPEPFHFTGRGDSGIGVALRPESRSSLLSLLAILNSPLATFFLANTSSPFRGGYYSFGKRFIGSLPIVEPGKRDREKLEALAKSMIKAKLRFHEGGSTAADAAAVEKIDGGINDIVYRLYGLSDAERGIVDDAIRPPEVAEDEDEASSPEAE